MTKTDTGRVRIDSIGDHEIHSREFGDADNAAILIHGLSGSSRWWARNIPALSRDRRLFVPDLIGFGRSTASGPLPGINQIARLLLEWIDRLDAERLSIVGHSMGGQIAVHVAALAPDRIDRLVLVDSAGMPRDLSPRALARFAAEMAPLWRWGDPTFLPVIAADAWAAGPRILLRAIRHIVVDDVRPLLPGIELPTLVVWGERDSVVPLRDAWAFRRLLPNGRLVIVRGAAHNSMIDRPGAFNEAVRRFLDGQEVGE